MSRNTQNGVTLLSLAAPHTTAEAHVDRTAAEPMRWKDVAHAVFNLKEFLYVP